MIARDIIAFMDQWAPRDFAEPWDNVGFQVGQDTREVSKILLALDLDREVLDYALDQGYQMIISHHPFIFGGIKSITNKDYDGSLLIDMIKNDIVFYAGHTNLDQVADGVSEQLGQALGLKDMEVLDPLDWDSSLGYGRVGLVERIDGVDLIDWLKQALNLDRLTVYGDLENKSFNKLALMGGSGASYIEKAAQAGAQVFLTGDIKYHDGQLANKLGLILIDPGHFHTEKQILARIKDRLEGLDENLELAIYGKPSPIYKIY